MCWFSFESESFLSIIVPALPLFYHDLRYLELKVFIILS